MIFTTLSIRLIPAGDGLKPCSSCRSFGHECVTRKRREISPAATPEGNGNSDAVLDKISTVLDRLSRLESLLPTEAANITGNSILPSVMSGQSVSQSVTSPATLPDLGSFQQPLPPSTSFTTDLMTQNVPSDCRTGDEDVQGDAILNVPTIGSSVSPTDFAGAVASNENDTGYNESVCSIEMVRYGYQTWNVRLLIGHCPV